MTLIEVLVSISIIAILFGGAYMAYVEHVREAKIIAAIATMRKIGEAVQSYNSTNSRPYTTCEVRYLLGPHLPEIPMDPWGNEFLIDFFFGRVVCLGEDMSINTFVPFPLWFGESRTIPSNDDLVVEYQHVGKLSCTRANKLFQLNPDGSMLLTVIGGGVVGADMVSNGTLFLFSNTSGDLTALTMADYTEQNLLALPAGCTNAGQVAWSPDCVQFACTANNAASESVIVAGLVVDSVGPYIVAKAAGTFTALAFSFDGRYLMLVDAAQPNVIQRATASSGSTLTPFVTDADNILQVACSPDGRYVAYSRNVGTGEICIVNGTTGEQKYLYVDAKWPAFSPDSNKLAFARGDEIWGVHLLECSDKPVPLSVFGAGASAENVSWD